MRFLWLLLGVISAVVMGWGVRSRRRTVAALGQLGLFVVALELLAGLALRGEWVGPPRSAQISPVEPEEVLGIPEVTPVAHYGLPGHLFPLDTRAPGHRPDRRTLVFVGDSFTHGNGVAPSDRFAEQVRRGLEAGSEVPVDAVNLGIPGFDLYSEVELFTDYGAAFAPDLVVWTFVVNDLYGGLIDRHAFWVPEAGNDLVEDHSFVPGVGVSDALSLLRWSVGSRLIEREVLKSYRQTLDPGIWPDRVAAARAGLEAVVRQTHARGGRFLLVLFPLMYRLDDPPLRAQHAQVAAWGRAAGAEVLDLTSVFEGRDASELWVTVRDHHPNARGHALAAEAMLEVLDAVPGAGPPVCAPFPQVEVGPRTSFCEDPWDPERALAWARWQADRDQRGNPHRVNQQTLQRLGAILAWHRAEGREDADALRAEAARVLRGSR